MNGAYTSDLIPIRAVNIGRGKLTFDGGHIVIGRAGSFTKTHWWSNGIKEAALNKDGRDWKCISESGRNYLRSGEALSSL